MPKYQIDTNVILCQHCNTPVAEVKGKFLILKAQHHGENHVSIFSLDELGEQFTLIYEDVIIPMKVNE